MSSIAERAGVSRTAVSSVLNGKQGNSTRVADETRRRILEAAEELGYRPNQLARAVALGKTRMVGYLVDEPRYEPYWRIMVGALEAAEELGFTLKLMSASGHTLAERARQCAELRLSGVVARVSGEKTALFEEANRAGIPVVTVDEGIPQPFGTRITSDDAPGIGRVLEHLGQLGHSRVAFIGSGFPRLFPTPHGVGDIGTVREDLFRREVAAREMELPGGYVTHDTVMVYGREVQLALDDSSARAATDALLSHPAGRPTAIFCWRDETALIAVAQCRRRGLRVPGDVSVVGFSDISAARLSEPPLSTVKAPLEEIGRLALQVLARRVDEDFDASPCAHLVPTTFIPRASSGPAPR